MVIEIALGIVLAVVILALLPVALGLLGLLLVRVVLPVALVGGLIYWVVNDPVSFGLALGGLASLFVIARLMSAVQRWLAQRSRFHLEDIVAVTLWSIFLLALIAQLLVEVSQHGFQWGKIAPHLALVGVVVAFGGIYLRLVLKRPTPQKLEENVLEDEAHHGL